MIVTHVEPGLDEHTCKIWTDYGTYERWPGRTVANGMQFWAWTPCSPTGRPTPVTVPATIRQLEQAFSRTKHPSNPRPPKKTRHLHVVHTPDVDDCDPHGIERPVVA